LSGGVWLVIATLALVAGAVFATLVQALRDLSRTTLEEIAAIKRSASGVRRVQNILDDVEGHAAAVALPRIMSNLVVVVCLVLWIAELRQTAALTWVDAAMGVATSSVLLWVFGVILPTSIAKHAGEATVYSWSRLLRVVYMVAGPFASITKVVDEVVKRLTGYEDKPEAEALEDELLSVVDDAQGEGKFDESERDMIEAVVRFRNRTVAQVMTPRTEIDAMELRNDLGFVTQTIRTIGHSRIPVYEGTLDNIVGIFYVKDLMRWLAGDGGGSRTGKTFELKSLLRPALFVPESKTVRELLPELLGKRVHIAMVADEYGGTAGVVTIEDIIEEVFGDIQDEYEEPGEHAAEVKLDGNAAEIDARAYIEDANEALAPLAIELPESEDYDTVGGFVTVTLGRIPQAGETMNLGRLLVTVLGAEPTRITRIKVELREPEPEDGVAVEQEQSPVETPSRARLGEPSHREHVTRP